MASVGVFISYNHKDGKIANALVEALTALSSDLEVFIDHAGLEGGDDYEAKLSISIHKSQWFIIICSGLGKAGKDMSWCFYEAGQFKAKLEAADQPKAVRDRLCYLYDEVRPSQLARYQGSLITTTDRNGTQLNVEVESDDALAYENTDLFDLFELILNKSSAAPLRDLNDSVRKLMRAGVRKVTLAFVRNRTDDIIDEEVFQPRISFDVPAPSPAMEAIGLKATSVVTGEYNALPTIFNIAGSTTTWGDIRARSAERSIDRMVPLWIEDLERAAKQVALGGLPAQTEFLCRATDDKFYRPIFARNEVYRSKGKKCYVAFIPARDRRFNLSFRTSLLISALILCIRFRQRVLPLVNDLAKALNAPEKKKAEILERLQTETLLVEAESVEFGLEAPRDEHEDPPLLNAFRDGEEKEYMRGELMKWLDSRNVIFEKIRAAANPAKETSWSEAANTVSGALSGMREVNSRFIHQLCIELLYAEKIETATAAAGATPL
jgi:TIR domain